MHIDADAGAIFAAVHLECDLTVFQNTVIIFALKKR